MGKSKTNIKINIKNLSSELDKISLQKKLYDMGQKNVKDLSPENGKGKAEDKLVAISHSYQKLSKDLGILMGNVESFLSCAKDGVVSADEYAARMMKNLG